MNRFLSNILSILDLFKGEVLGSPILEAIAALATILSALGVGRYLRRWRKRIRGVYKSERFDDSFLREHTQFFKPNDIKPAVPNDQDSIAYLAGLFMDNNQKKSKFFLLKAATGIGKTTFVVNLFLAIAKRIDGIEHRRIMTEKKRVGYWLGLVFRRMWSGIRRIIPAARNKGVRHVILVRFNDLVYDKQLLDAYINNGKAKHTIVLVDAMDEYTPNGHVRSSEYWNELKKEWESIAEKLAKFGTVFLSVREQFLNENNPIIGKKIAGLDFSEIELLPFRPEQGMAYVKERYNDDSITHFVHRFYILQEEQGSSASKGEVFQIPLILSKAGEIKAYQQEIQQSGYSLYSIYKAIVKSWLQREDIDHEVDIPNIELLCQQIAYRFTQEGAHPLGIPESELEAVKEGSNIEALRKIAGHRERTLLRRNEEVTSNKITGASRTIYYHFAHRVFLEFFLAELALSDRTYEAKIPFERYSTAADMFIKQRWEKGKADFPQVREGDLNDIWYRHRAIPLPTLGVNFLRKAHQFFKDFSHNPYIIDKIRSPRKEEGVYLLENKPAKAITTFKGLHNTVISNVNFWDESTSAPIPETQEVIPFLRGLISTLCLDAIPLSSSEDLRCFEGVDSLEELVINNIPVVGNCLSFFSGSRSTLVYLRVDGCGITDDQAFKPFEGISVLRCLVLNDNRLNGTCLRYFSNSRSILEQLSLANNNITDDEMFKPLEGAISLRTLELGDNKLTGACVRYFSNSRSTLEQLGLANNNITDDEMLKPLEGASALRSLILNGNGLNGTCIRYFANSRSTLEELGLANNNITANDEVLKFIRLRGGGTLRFPFLDGNGLNGT